MTMYIAHLGHPWCDETMAVIRKHPRMFSDVSALQTRPMQLYGALRSAIEYGVVDKLLFGTDFPFATVSSTIGGMRDASAMADRVGLPPIPMSVVDEITHRPSLDSARTVMTPITINSVEAWPVTVPILAHLVITSAKGSHVSSPFCLVKPSSQPLSVSQIELAK